MAVEMVRVGTLGGRIRAVREAAGLSLEQLSERSGVAVDHLSGIEQGAEFETGQLDLIALALGIGVHDLLLTSDLGDVLMRAGEANQAQAQAAIAVLARFVRDYEFLRALEE